MPRRLSAMLPTAPINCPTSSLRCTSMLTLRSPSAMRLAMPITWRSGRTIIQVISNDASAPTSSASAAEPMIDRVLVRRWPCIAARWAA